MKKIKMPHVYITLLIVMTIVVGLSYFIPSGSYGQIPDSNGNLVMDINNFTFVNNSHKIGVLDFFLAIHNGIVQSGDIIISLIIIGGILYIYEDTGTIGAGIHKILSLAKGRELLVVLSLNLAFIILGSIGLCEGMLPFVPLVTTVVMALGYDRVVGVAVSQFGIAVGFTSGLLNLYTTGTSQKILELPLFSGLWFRFIGLIVFSIISLAYIAIYCIKIKKNPNLSVVANEYKIQKIENIDIKVDSFTFSRQIAIVLLIGVFAITSYGALNYNWGLGHFSACYLILGVLLTIVFRLNPNKCCEMFSTGAARILPAALTIGIARGTMILMQQAKIIDTCIYYLARLLENKNIFSVLLIIYVSVIIFNFFILSATGKAMIMMPILGPLGKILNINQQVMVLVYQYGDGITNYFWPSSGGLLVALAMCKLEWSSWVKFAWKFILFWTIIAFIMVLIAYKIKLGPF